MSEEAERLVRRITELKGLNDQLRASLQRHRGALDEAAGLVTGGALTADVIRAAGAAEIRMDLTDAIGAFEQSRHRVRVAMFAYLAKEPDMSTTDIGRTLGISRQLASRLAHEAEHDGEPSEDDTPPG